MKASLFLAALLIVGDAYAQGSSATNNTAMDPRQQFDAFCAVHAADCAQLKALHEAAHQACAKGQAQSTACRQARDSVHAQMQKLESLGLPRPTRPPGPPPEAGDRSAPIQDDPPSR